jgi:3-deoxy-D-manno-octulosonic-acid transferase
VKNAKGYAMIVEAAQAASATFEKHWLRMWVPAHLERFKRCKTDWGRRMASSGFFSDIETIIKETPCPEQ